VTTVVRDRLLSPQPDSPDSERSARWYLAATGIKMPDTYKIP
jgi:hypothetical protein